MTHADQNEQVIARLKTGWDGNKFYKAAEDWTFLFWQANHPFRPIFDMLNRGNVLELACGHGRHAAISKDLVKTLTLMDIVESNLDACRARFPDAKNVKYHLGTGADFAGIAKGSLDSIYCYDAMVHFPQPIVESYVADTARVLKRGGRALYHHSNSLSAPNVDASTTPHGRAPLSATAFRAAAEKAGLKVLQQKIIKWGRDEELDCITLLEK